MTPSEFFDIPVATIRGTLAEYRERGLVVLGFPCDQFGPDPGAGAEVTAGPRPQRTEYRSPAHG